MEKLGGGVMKPTYLVFDRRSARDVEVKDLLKQENRQYTAVLFLGGKVTNIDPKLVTILEK